MPDMFPGVNLGGQQSSYGWNQAYLQPGETLSSRLQSQRTAQQRAASAFTQSLNPAAVPGYGEASPSASGSVRSRIPSSSIAGTSSYGDNMGTMQQDYARIMGDYQSAIDAAYNDIGVQTETEARNTAERRLSMGRGMDASMVSRGLANFTTRGAALAEHAKTTDELLGNIRDQGRGRQNALRLSGAQTMLAANQRAQSEARQFALDQQRFGLEQARLLQQQRQYDNQYRLQQQQANQVRAVGGGGGGGGGGGRSIPWIQSMPNVGYGGYGPMIGNAAYGMGYGDPGLGSGGYNFGGGYGQGNYDFSPVGGEDMTGEQFYNENYGGGDAYSFDDSGWDYNADSGEYDYWG